MLNQGFIRLRLQSLISFFCILCCSYVVVMPKKRQALVEYEDMNGSSTAVTYAADNQVYIAGHPAFINYSTSQKISRPGDSDDSRTVNNVLLLTIMNPIYPITSVTTGRLIGRISKCVSLVVIMVDDCLLVHFCTGCPVHHLQQLWSCPENRHLQEEWCPSHGRISF